MKKLIILSLVFAFSFTAKAQTDSTQLAKNIVEALKSGKIENLQNLVAPPSVYREKFEEAKGLTDEQIIEKTSKSPELKAHFNALIAEAKEKNIDLSKLEYKGAGRSGLIGVVILVSIGEKTGELTVSRMEHNGSWYFVELLAPITVLE